MDNVQSRNHYLQVRNTSLLYYSVSDTVRSNRSNASTYFGNNDSRESDTLSTYSGNMTRGSVKNIRRAVDIMLQITPTQRIYNPILSKEVDFRLSFITLTVSDNTRFISGKECYEKCLKPFLDWLRRSQKCNTYIWKAERQKATTFDGAIKNSKGQIHYHITCNAFINYDTLRKKWNSLQKEAGYLVPFAEKYKHYNPNSTDIHSVYKVENIEAYLTKYISKAPEKMDNESAEEFKARCTVDGKVWDCSSNLRGTKYFKTEYNDAIHDKLQMNTLIGNLKKLDIEHVSFYCLNRGKCENYLGASAWLDYCFYKRNIKNGSITQQTE